MIAYLVIREGTKWTDVYRLTPGQVVTIGRAPTNHIVVKDERCSRHHSEIFLSQQRWTLRDLDSRNGTLVANRPIKGDFALSPGDIVRIGQSQLRFVHDLS
ncbi:MAG: FHA domain-containing protein, partial [Pirellulales bacterium]